MEPLIKLDKNSILGEEIFVEIFDQEDEIAKARMILSLTDRASELGVTIVEKNGVDGLRDEIEFRNATKIHTLLDRKSLEIATRKIKEMTMDTFTILCVATLRDEFDFGTKRCQRFIDRMNLRLSV